jgi:riboflavin kinase / FMN adenylyltransferase
MSMIPLSWTEPTPASCRGGAVTLGNFDGVHSGHQAIIAATVLQARAAGGPAVAVTFDPHPLQILRPEQFQPVLTTVPQRAELLRIYGADHVVVLPTSPALLQFSPTEFFEQVVRDRLAARTVVEGFNFRFGKDREGSTETLAAMCAAAGLVFQLVPPLTLAEQPVSSSRVRRELEQGRVRAAAELLGRPYQISGTVVQGERRGQTLGFPTANLAQIGTLIPGDGVYAARAALATQSWPAAVNIGPNPTFGEQVRKVEAHLIGFQGELYGQKLTVDLLDRLRDTLRFAGAAELSSQLRADVAKAADIAGSAPLSPSARAP